MDISETIRNFASEKEKLKIMEGHEVMTATEPAAAVYPMTSYADVMYYLHTIDISREDKERIANRLKVEVTGVNLSRIFERLNHLRTLQADRDGRGAMPISRQVINNVRQVLAISDDTDWMDWMISPNVNATIMLQSRKRRASISLGGEEYSYYARIDGKDQGENHVAFNPAAFLSLMRNLNK